MARGGYRPGSGRRKGSKNWKSLGEAAAPIVVQPVPQHEIPPGMSPLEYMLSVMRDGDADSARRDRMAIAAAPFCHARAADAMPGKKEREAEKARLAVTTPSSQWGDDLNANVQPN